MQPEAGAPVQRKVAAISADIRALKRYRCRWPRGEHADVRELPCVGDYRVLYDVNPDTGRNGTSGDVRVLRVYGAGQERIRP